MYAREFCYWLQGAFEVGGLPALTNAANVVIKKHLDMVASTDQEGQPIEAVSFCQWLNGGIDFIQHENLEQTETVRKRLDAVFLHVIDPSYKEHAKLGPIHGSGKPRC